MDHILVVCLNPTFQRTMVFDSLLEGEVNRCSNYRLDVSGKGVNVARVISQLGGEAIHLTHLGGKRSLEMIEMLDEDGIETLWSDSHSPIRTCTTLLNTSKKSTTELVEEPFEVDSSTDQKIRKLYSEALKRVATVVISGTRAPGYSPSLYPDFVKEAKKSNKRVILDIKGDDLLESLPFKPDLVKPNLSEFASTFMPHTTVYEQEDSREILDSVIEKMREIYTRYNCSTLLTRGSFSTWVYGPNGFEEFETKRVEPVNTIGCGDSVAAGIAFELSRNTPFTEAIKRGLACGVANATTLRPGSVVDDLSGILLC